VHANTMTRLLAQLRSEDEAREDGGFGADNFS